jgi:uncharacterized protein GlcG (DUF336 family)
VGDVTFGKASITADAAEHMLDAAVEAARAMGKRFTIAIVDDAGALKALLRMDGAVLVSVQTAQDKAYSAVAAARPTHACEEVLKTSPMLAAGVPAGIDRMIVFGGGYPVVVDGQIVGGVGASGGSYKEDMKVAEAALTAIEETT